MSFTRIVLIYVVVLSNVITRQIRAENDGQNGDADKCSVDAVKEIIRPIRAENDDQDNQDDKCSEEAVHAAMKKFFDTLKQWAPYVDTSCLDEMPKEKDMTGYTFYGACGREVGKILIQIAANSGQVCGKEDLKQYYTCIDDYNNFGKNCGWVPKDA